MRMRINPEDIVGNNYGKVVIKKYIGYFQLNSKNNKKDHFYECECICGNTAIAPRGQILRGKRKTCGDCTHIEKEKNYYRYYDVNGNSFIFDSDDLDFVKSYRWIINENGYAFTNIKNKNVRFTRLLLGISGKMCVDHINGDKRDNRKSNLRVGSNSQNHGNQALNRRNTTGYKGVSYNKRTGKYRAYITKNRKWMTLGVFEDPKEAASAYDRAARFYFGEFACVNFPLQGEQSCKRNQIT